MAEARTIKFETPACPYCGESSVVDVDLHSYTLWMGGHHIQDAFKDLSAPEREQLMTGFHPTCWEAVFTHERNVR